MKKRGALECGCGLLRFAGRFARRRLFLLLSGRRRALIELVDASRRIYQLLLTGKQRMTSGTNFNGDLGQR